MRITMLTAVAAVAVAGCATHAYRPMVDFAGSQKTQAEYEMDLQDCQAYARQISLGGEAVAGLLAGALVGAALGVAIGDSGDWASAGARGGAVGGAVGGGANAAQTQVDIIRRCMSGRGYNVLA